MAASSLDFAKFAVTVRVTAQATQENVVAALSTAHQIYVTRLSWSFDDTGTSEVDVQDDSGTPQNLLKIFTSTTAGVNGCLQISNNEMIGGVKVAVGKNIDVINAGAAVDGWVYIEGYQRKININNQTIL